MREFAEHESDFLSEIRRTGAENYYVQSPDLPAA
jgi:hypothetical protein